MCFGLPGSFLVCQDLKKSAINHQTRIVIGFPVPISLLHLPTTLLTEDLTHAVHQQTCQAPEPGGEESKEGEAGTVGHF